MRLLYFVCYIFFFRYGYRDQIPTHSCVSRNHRQLSETSVSCYKKMAEHTIFMYSAIIAVLILLDSLTDQISHLSGSNLLFALVHDINGAVSLCENLSDRILDSICFLVKVEGEAEHHSCGEDRRDRICDVFSCDIRCGTMARLVETKFALI